MMGLGRGFGEGEKKEAKRREYLFSLSTTTHLGEGSEAEDAVLGLEADAVGDLGIVEWKGETREKTRVEVSDFSFRRAFASPRERHVGRCFRSLLVASFSRRNCFLG